MRGRMELMATKSQRAPRRTEALSRDVIVKAATEILDAEGEDALTLRALTVRLATGYGAIYHHVADRDDLLAAATDHVIARVVTDLAADAEPRQALRPSRLACSMRSSPTPGSVPSSTESLGGRHCWTSTRASASNCRHSACPSERCPTPQACS